jgi:hypothetical protein
MKFLNDKVEKNGYTLTAKKEARIFRASFKFFSFFLGIKSLEHHTTFKTFIFSFFSKNAKATSETTLSKALPIPKSNAIPMSDGVHTPVKYKTNAIP